MEFALSEEQEAIFDLAYSFGQENIAPFSIDWENQGTIPKELWAKTSELGFGGIYVSEEYGGSGLSRLDATLIFEVELIDVKKFLQTVLLEVASMQSFVQHT